MDLATRIMGWISVVGFAALVLGVSMGWLPRQLASILILAYGVLAYLRGRTDESLGTLKGLIKESDRLRDEITSIRNDIGAALAARGK